MARTLFGSFLLWLAEIPSWLMLLAGIAVLASTVLVGPWLQNRELKWERDLITLQAQRLGQQEQSYNKIITALDDDDPILLKRLAYHYLRLKPQGVTLVHDPHYSRQIHEPVAEPMSTIESWVHRPMPVVGVDFPAFRPLHTRLVEMTTGPLRPLLVVGAGLMIAIGLVPLVTRSPDTSRT